MIRFRRRAFDALDRAYLELREYAGRETERADKAEQEVGRVQAPLQKLLNTQEAMLQRWAEAALPGQRLSDVQQELWRALHEAADNVRAALDTPTPTEETGNE